MFSRMIMLILSTGCCIAVATGQDGQLADPMRPAIRAPRFGGNAGADQLRLQGIVIAESRKLALIAGEFLEEGQQIHGLRILSIDRETVTATRDGKTVTLRPESAPAEPVEPAESAEEPGESR